MEPENYYCCVFFYKNWIFYWSRFDRQCQNPLKGAGSFLTPLKTKDIVSCQGAYARELMQLNLVRLEFIWKDF